MRSPESTALSRGLGRVKKGRGEKQGGLMEMHYIRTRKGIHGTNEIQPLNVLGSSWEKREKIGDFRPAVTGEK